MPPESPQPVFPPIHLSAELLDSVQAAVPPAPADAPLAWHPPSRAHLIAAIAAYTPTDAAQACLAAQIVTCRLVAEDMRWRSSAPELPKRFASRLRRASIGLMRAATQLENPLRRWQKLAARDAGAQAPGALDLAALMALWGRSPTPDRSGEILVQPDTTPQATPAPRAPRIPRRRRTGGASPFPDPTDQPAPAAG